MITARTGKSDVAIVVGDAALRSKIARHTISFYRFAEYQDAPLGLAGCRAHPPRIAVVSEELAGGGGFDFVRMLRLDPKLNAIPVVMLVANDDTATRDRIARCGAEHYLARPYARSTLVAALSGVLNHCTERSWRRLPARRRQALTHTLTLFNNLADGIANGEPVLYRAVGDACEALVEAVANNDYRGILQGVRDHDNYSYVHSVRVATYLALFGVNLGLPKDEQILLASGGLLHDVGKMSIPHEVLNKPGRLTPAEFEVMKGHVPASLDYLRHCSDLPKGIFTIAAQHHEKLDGTGYPLGLTASKLNRLARMASIIDVFSALTDRRVYKPMMEAETALNIMSGEMGSHLDVKLLGLFRAMLLDATRPPAEVA